MIKIQRHHKALLLFFAIIFSQEELGAMNLLQPYAVLERPFGALSTRFRIESSVQAGTYTRNFDCNGFPTNPLTIWHQDQNALKMLEGFAADSPITALRTMINATDNGTRGHLDILGTFDVNFYGTISAYASLFCNWTLSAHLPIYQMQLSNIHIADKTTGNDMESVRVRNLLTNNIKQNIFDLGKQLSLEPWKRAGVGDTTLLIEWSRGFHQARPLLHHVQLWFRAGLSLPTGKKTDENLLIALPFGYDGSVATPFGGGLELTIARYLHIGGDVLLTYAYGNTRCRRIKTNPQQTELFLLEKLNAFQDFGLTQEFSIFGRCVDLCIPGSYFTIGYHYRKHNDNTLSLTSNHASSEVANTAEKLLDWTTHQIILQAGLAKQCSFQKNTFVPHVAFTAHLPFNGKRSITSGTAGIILSLDF